MAERSRPAAPKLTWIILYSSILFLLLPLMMMVISSLIVITPEGVWSFSFIYWLEVLQDTQLAQFVRNSFFVALVSSGAAVAVGTCAALALAKVQFFGETFLRTCAVLALVFPEIVFALSLLSLFFILGFKLSLWTVILAHISFSLPYVMLTVGARAARLEKSLDDSARDLGATDWTLLTRIHLPLLKPAIISAFFLSFILSFDDFLITFFVNGVGSDTLPIKLYTAMKTGITPQLNALTTLIFLGSSVSLVLLLRSQVFARTVEGLKKSID